MRCWYSASRTTDCGAAVVFGFQFPIAFSRSTDVRRRVLAKGAGSFGIGAFTLGGAAAALATNTSAHREAH
jgi:hypothetical protein